MANIHFDATLSDDERRDALYRGDLFVYEPTPASLALVEHARAMVEAAFAPLDPRHAHESLAKEDCVAILAQLKPSFIHHPESKRLIREMLSGFGCDPTQVYFDVPRMRSSYPSAYLTTGIAYAFPHHRDTWYSAPQCQLNWWLPIYEITANNGLLFTPRYFDQPIANNSSAYNYYLWNANSRGAAAAQVNKETRTLPEALVPVAPEDNVHLVVPPGGTIVFSAAQLHASVPNATNLARYSIDFRTVHLDDARQRRGAPNVDSECTGHTMRDYLNMNDLTHVPDDIVSLYDDGTEKDGVLLYEPSGKQ